MWSFRSETSLTCGRYRRAAELVMAIEAWKIDHGRLPNTLEQLIGKYVDKLPVDPYNGQQVRYEPKGFPERVLIYIYWRTPDSLRAMAPGQPFVGGVSDYPSFDLWQSEGPVTFDAVGLPNIPDFERKWDWILPIPTSGEKPSVVPPPQ
jgi:hypothetical protein